jgi:hypothetical protein
MKVFSVMPVFISDYQQPIWEIARLPDHLEVIAADHAPRHVLGWLSKAEV